MTPIQIKLMLHYYVFPTDYESAEHPDLIDQARKHFVGLGLLRTSAGPQYEITPKGTAFVEMLKDVPIPEIVYVDPRFQK